MGRKPMTTVPMTPTYFRVLVRNLGVPRKVIDQALAAAGLGSAAILDVDRTISVGEQLNVFGELARRLPPGWGLRAGRRFHAATHGPLGIAFVSAPDLRTSLDMLERFGPVRLPYVRARTAVRRRDRYALGFDVGGPIDATARVALLELAAVARKNLLESVLGESIAGACFDFDYAAPSYAARYAEELGAPARFDRPETAISIPAAWLDRRCSTSDPTLFATALEQLETRKRQLESREFVVAQVEDLLSSSGDSGLSVEQVARRLGVSRRSLTRRLAEVGTTYRALRDAHRRHRAEQLLRNRNLDIGEIAWKLGYRDLANFGRAARRWFGMPPGRYRRTLV